MGLDVVELVMRVEEEFAINLPDDECGQMRTVGHLYRLVLKKLNLEYRPAAEIEREQPPNRHTYVKLPLNTTSVWYTIKGIIVEQLQVDPNDVHEDSRFMDDLGAD